MRRVIIVTFAALCCLAGGRAALAAALTGSGRAAPLRLGPAPVYDKAFGRLEQPSAVALGPGGRVWVADKASGRVTEFSGSGRLLATFGSLLGPSGIATGPGGNVWVSDTGRDRVVEFTPRGTRIREFGSAGSARGKLRGPAGLAVAPGGDVFVADSGNNRVDRFSARGRLLSSFPVPTPAAVALDKAGHVWVSSPSYAGGNEIYEYTAAGSELNVFGSTQATYGALSDPGGIAIGPGGRVYVAQPDYGLVSVFGHGGSFLTEFGLQEKTSLSGRDLAFPEGLAVAAGGTVFVADTGNGRVVEFSPASSTPAAGGAAGASWRILIFGLMAGCLLAFAFLLALARRRGHRVSPSEPAGVSRRTVMASATLLTGAAFGAGVLPASVRRALAESAARPAAGSLADIKHVVILMQENRSFDHYFGAMPGVRGFNDPTAIKLPDGRPVFCQPDHGHAQGYLLPFRYDTKTTSAQATPGTDHSWPTQHQAWNNGRMDQWIAAKGPYTMGYFGKEDIPFHWALAEAFTVCDNYHCSVFGPTNPNRLYMWTGMIDPEGKHGGPVIDNTPAYDNVILSWKTYPERLEAAGISWQVYQEEDNYDDNALAWFTQYAAAGSSSPLYQRGMRKMAAGSFEQDARHDRLPQVSWLVAPTAQSEHPDFLVAAGAEYIAQKLDAIASNADVWAKTAFILCYDENDGLFDHVVPPTAPRGTRAEFVDGLNIGLGFRTPTTIVSPWTAGGYVCSDVFDHSSLIRFLEARFGVREPNISAWRRRTCGDLTSAFRFSAGAASYPAGNTRLRLATAEAALLTAQHQVSVNPAPVVPAKNQPLP